ncbi:hypothetical protein HUN33_00350 [Acinetobacter bereziniae]|uniref:hypothetical protein n=1 Tax=Acinetobacter bereziniae TaxID=106648 RepID=UPI00157FD12C|nr:hypothetical protein [Acinetobacter bereziniae]NUF61539.1 hypothetical protein [Acinetobacter bereziniae]NUG06145.1 hypothetical protein [Acinetobacter bereziniae]NUG62300.1 hypothetical protein [Acinetobacter bereziniae]NUG69198.1 hypothetical protein [Acinetobacter bereziniae]NUG78508.1 hypothetical protein [Acinetobacter bereziniae]
MKDQCKQAVAKALGKTQLTQQEADNIEQRIRDAMKSRARQDIDAWRNLSDSEKLTAAGEQVAIDIKADIKRKNKIAANDILTQSKNLAQLDHPKLSASEVIDRMVAPHGDMSGIQSLDSKARAIATIYRGDLTDFYTNIKGGLGVFTDLELVQNIVRERFNQNTGDALAKKISDKMGDVFENMRERFNRSGGDIGKLDDWGLPQTHNLEKIAKVGKDEWVNQSEQLIDTSKYVHENGEFYSQQEIRELLEYAFDTLTSNGANKTEIGRQATGRGTLKVTSRHSESRVLHFKDADSWMEYQQKFGGLPLVDLVEAHVNGLSKDIALVENLGSNPKNAMRLLMDAAEQKDWANGLNPKDTIASRKRAQTMFEEFTGQNTPQSEVLANLGLAYRSMNVASMLGGTTLSSITDQAMIAKTASIHGIAYRKTFGELVSQLNPKNKEDRELARSLGLATEEMLGSINRWSDDGLASVSGKTEKIARVSNSVATQIMRISGLNALTAASKVGFSKMLMDKYGTLTRSKSWDQLSDIDRELMEKTGINERAWKVMQVAEPIVDRKGNQLMSAKSIYQIPDEKIIGAMDDDFKKLQDNTDAQLNELNQRNFEDDQRIANKAQQIDELKQQLSQRLQDYANRTDSKSSAEKQALQDRIDLLNTQNEASAAQADLNTYIRTIENQEDLKGFIDGITQGKTIDNLTDKAKKLGRTLESLDNKVVTKTTRLNDKIKTFEKEIQGKFSDFTELLNSKSKLSKDKLIEYEGKLSERLNRYASRRDVNVQKELDALNELKDLVALKQERLDTDFEVRKAQEQTRIKQKTDQKIDSSISRNSRRNYKSGEDLGYRLGNAERRMVELRAKIRKAESEANKSIDKKFNELDKRVKSLDDEFSQYQTRINDRQAKRSQAIEGITNSIDDNRKELAQKIRDEVASQFQAHILDEQGMAVVEAGLRERTWMSAGQKKGTAMGEIVKGILQFKSFPAAFLMRHGSRAMSMDKGTSKAAYGLSIFAMTTLLGALVVQLKEITNGNDPQTVWDSEDPNKLAKFFTRSAVQGGGLSVLGDILVAGADPSGRGTSDFIAGPLGSDVKTVLGVTVGNALQAYEGKDTNAANEVFKLIKSKLPAQNLWYTKAAMNRMIFDEMQDVIAPGYREKLMRKAQREQDRTQWWGDDIGDIQAPDFDKVIQ